MDALNEGGNYSVMGAGAKSMRILQIHSRYRSGIGGEDVVVLELVLFGEAG